MPKGKGTYGSQVGRPSKKQKYQVSGEVLEAAQMGQELESIPLGGIESDFPISNAQERGETYQLGGAVQPPTAPSMPPAPQYKEGGKVQEINILDIVPKAEEYADINRFNKEKYGKTWKQPHRKKRIEKMVGEAVPKKKKGKKK
tara:strand:+ start:361 stop:792 length:432 start_codon:yes stop_codon:yes gene_type:complete